tara:strand:- start:587 stop:895 length:309 start_codon:yes stop_codon:yes gene_type:complete
MAQALLELERALRELGFWAAAPPAADRMSSAAPFCIDTLSFEEWLQWILIPRLGGIAARRERLSAGASIMPMGEQSFAHLGRRQQPLLVVLAQIDQLSHKLL